MAFASRRTVLPSLIFPSPHGACGLLYAAVRFPELNQFGDTNDSYQEQTGIGNRSNTFQDGTTNQATSLQNGNLHGSNISQSGLSNVSLVIQN